MFQNSVSHSIPSHMSSVTPSLMIRTLPLEGGGFRSDWRTNERQGYILCHPPNGSARRALAELLALHAVTGLVRPLRMRDLQERGPILVSAPEIPGALACAEEYAHLQSYVRFIRLSLADFQIELHGIEDWPRPSDSVFVESLELFRTDPWDDVVHISKQSAAAPTALALDIIRAHLKTTAQWKAWASLYLTAPAMILLPAEGAPTEPCATRQFLCPKYGWILIVKDGRIIGIRGARAPEHQAIVDLLLAQQSALSEEAVASAAIYAIRMAQSSAERLFVLSEFLRALPAELRQIRRAGIVHEHNTALNHVMKAALDATAPARDRASLLRCLLEALPADESQVALPDGSHASVTGHVLDRLMTRFNMRSAIAALIWLHSNARKLRPVQLSPLLQASKDLKYDAAATHWRHFNEWAIVVSNGAVVTAYFPKARRER